MHPTCKVFPPVTAIPTQQVPRVDLGNPAPREPTPVHDKPDVYLIPDNEGQLYRPPPQRITLKVITHVILGEREIWESTQ